MAIKNNSLLIILIIIFFAIAGVLNRNIVKPTFVVSKQQSALNINQDFINIFDLGQKRLLSDILWITTLLESDLSHYKGKDLNSWLYLRFLTISTLDPLFLQNYQFGGQYLSIIKDDLLGAEVIFDLGIEKYPDDYTLLFNAGFLQAFELQNFQKAIPLYVKLSNNPMTPRYVISLINKLKYSLNKDLEVAFQLVKESYVNTNDKFLKDKLRQDLYSIRATIDLKCLNLKKNNCKTNDLDGNPYLYDKKTGKYKAVRKFYEYKLKKKGSNLEP